MKKKVLIVEDEKKIARFIQLELEHAGYIAGIENNGINALNKIVQENWDIILLDVMLPGMFGVEVCKRVREVSEVPIIMITGKGDIDDKVRGLDAGADDYLVKPFDGRELLARMRVCLRKKRDNDKPVLTEELRIRNLVLVPERFEVMLSNEMIYLTKKEFDLLEYLLRNSGLVLSREQILQNVWGYEYDGGTNVVDVYVRYIRSKLNKVSEEEFIQTVRGVGYVLK